MSNTITPTVFYRTLNVEGLEIFYREAGPRDAPTVLLLHGFPSSSHTAAAAFLLAFREPDRFTLDKLLNRLRN
jgi:pimeloyl-ACP methyl ester carboxylesterase